jgi:hypothetical protein
MAGTGENITFFNLRNFVKGILHARCGIKEGLQMKQGVVVSITLALFFCRLYSLPKHNVNLHIIL